MCNDTPKDALLYQRVMKIMEELLDIFVSEIFSRHFSRNDTFVIVFCVLLSLLAGSSNSRQMNVERALHFIWLIYLSLHFYGIFPSFQ